MPLFVAPPLSLSVFILLCSPFYVKIFQCQEKMSLSGGILLSLLILYQLPEISSSKLTRNINKTWEFTSFTWIGHISLVCSNASSIFALDHQSTNLTTFESFRKSMWLTSRNMPQHLKWANRHQICIELNWWKRNTTNLMIIVYR